jgi:hypothetical protein
LHDREKIHYVWIRDFLDILSWLDKHIPRGGYELLTVWKGDHCTKGGAQQIGDTNVSAAEWNKGLVAMLLDRNDGAELLTIGDVCHGAGLIERQSGTVSRYGRPLIGLAAAGATSSALSTRAYDHFNSFAHTYGAKACQDVRARKRDVFWWADTTLFTRGMARAAAECGKSSGSISLAEIFAKIMKTEEELQGRREEQITRIADPVAQVAVRKSLARLGRPTLVDPGNQSKRVSFSGHFGGADKFSTFSFLSGDFSEEGVDSPEAVQALAEGLEAVGQEGRRGLESDTSASDDEADLGEFRALEKKVETLREGLKPSPSRADAWARAYTAPEPSRFAEFCDRMLAEWNYSALGWHALEPYVYGMMKFVGEAQVWQFFEFIDK